MVPLGSYWEKKCSVVHINVNHRFTEPEVNPEKNNA
jgi:hypothetical protein